MRAIANESPLLFIVSGQKRKLAKLVCLQTIYCVASPLFASCIQSKTRGIFLGKPPASTMEIGREASWWFHVEVIVVFMLIVYSFFWNLLVS